MNPQMLFSALSHRQRWLVKVHQEHPFSRIEHLHVSRGEPDPDHPPTIIQKLRMGGDNGRRPESELPDFWLKKPILDLLETIAELGEGEIRSIEVAHGLPLTVEIERKAALNGEPTHA
jgi:hypothetical protein